jgi:hypothetical protein
MAVTVQAYDQFTQLLTAGTINQSNLRVELLNNSASFVHANTTKEQVDNGSTATITMTIAAPGVITDTAHGFSAGQAVAFTTTGALPTGLTAGTFYYIVSPTTNTYSVALTAGGAAITTTGTQSGTHTRHSSGSYETYGNGWIPGGPTLASVSITAASINSTGINSDAVFSATNPSVTATGGSLPPSAAYNALIYDATTFKALLFVSFGQAQQAGVTTNFVFLINALGLFNIVAPNG